MSAKVHKKFDKRFELNEESIRRIHSDISKRIPTENRNNIVFEVSREDHLVFRTSEIDRVLSESNDSTQKITTLKVEYHDEKINILLTFDADEGSELKIIGENRDDVFLISSELKEYIQKEVCNISSITKNKKILMLPIIILGVSLTYMMASAISSPPVEDVKIVLESNDLSQKLNYIIKENSELKTRTKGLPLFAIAPLLLLIALLIPGQKMYNYLLPGNIFLIGKQISVIASRRDITRNLFWCVLVALLIAIGTGYYFLWLSK